MKFKIGDRIRPKKSVSKYTYTNLENNWEGKVTGFKATPLSPIMVEAVTTKCKYPEKLGHHFTVCEEQFELVEDSVELHVTAKGNVTTAVKKVNGKVVARAEAKCSPRDTYDAETGIRIALAKLAIEEAMRGGK